MITELRDPEFAESIENLAEAIRWPDASFTLDVIETAAEVLVAIYDAFATPDPTLIRNAFRGIGY